MYNLSGPQRDAEELPESPSELVQDEDPVDNPASHLEETPWEDLSEEMTLRTACDRCHDQKLRCIRHAIGGQCQRCFRANLMCSFSVSRRLGRPTGSSNSKKTDREPNTIRRRRPKNGAALDPVDPPDAAEKPPKAKRGRPRKQKEAVEDHATKPSSISQDKGEAVSREAETVDVSPGTPSTTSGVERMAGNTNSDANKLPEVLGPQIASNRMAPEADSIQLGENDLELSNPFLFQFMATNAENASTPSWYNINVTAEAETPPGHDQQQRPSQLSSPFYVSQRSDPEIFHFDSSPSGLRRGPGANHSTYWQTTSVELSQHNSRDWTAESSRISQHSRSGQMKCSEQESRYCLLQEISDIAMRLYRQREVLRNVRSKNGSLQVGAISQLLKESQTFLKVVRLCAPSNPSPPPRSLSLQDEARNMRGVFNEDNLGQPFGPQYIAPSLGQELFDSLLDPSTDFSWPSHELNSKTRNMADPATDQHETSIFWNEKDPNSDSSSSAKFSVNVLKPDTTMVLQLLTCYIRLVQVHDATYSHIHSSLFMLHSCGSEVPLILPGLRIGDELLSFGKFQLRYVVQTCTEILGQVEGLLGLPDSHRVSRKGSAEAGILEGSVSIGFLEAVMGEENAQGPGSGSRGVQSLRDSIARLRGPLKGLIDV